MKIRPTSRLGAMVLALTGVLAFSVAVPVAQAGPTPAADNSLTVKEYAEGGVPSIDKAWAPDDFQKAATALEAIAKADPTKLPRFGSKTSGELFAHIIAQKNLDIFSDKTVPIDTRIQKAALITAYAPIFQAYASATKADSTYDAEVLELGGFLLRAELAAAIAVTEFKAAHNIKEDNEGFKTARAGYAQTAGGIVEVMMDHANVRISESIRFIAELKMYLPKLAAEFTPEAQERLKVQLKQAAANEADKDLKAALIDLLAAL